MKCDDIINYIEKFCPKTLAEEWDNVGLLVGDREGEIKKILVALDATSEVIEETVNCKADLLVTHHPLFNPKWTQIRSITTESFLGSAVHKLIKNNISLYCAHTNLDIAKGGVNDVLVDLLGLQNIKILDINPYEEAEYGLGRIGELSEEITVLEFAKMVKDKLKVDSVRVISKNNKLVKKVAICSGSGMSLIDKVFASGADVYITGDVKYHDAQNALENGLSIIDAGHFGTENVVVSKMREYIEKLGDIEVVESKVDGNPFKIV